MFQPERAANLPEELKLLPQWVGATEGKLPIDPRSKENDVKASHSNPATWDRFDTVFAGVLVNRWPNLGFVVSKKDNYIIIDLDQAKDLDGNILPADHPEQIKRTILNKNRVEIFNSWTERSIHGGYHIVVIGDMPDDGCKSKDGIEMYKANHYLMMTGDVVRNMPIQDRTELVKETFEEIRKRQSRQASNNSTWEDKPETETDIQVMERMFAAANGADSRLLWDGKWETMLDDKGQRRYPSHSEADMAMFERIGYFTKNNEQLQRIYRNWCGYRPEKSERDMKGMMPRLRSEQVVEEQKKEVEVERIKEATKNWKATTTETKKVIKPPPLEYPMPPGTIGEIAQCIYELAVIPVWEVAYAASIGLAAGIVGRRFNISMPPTGLNQYILLLARTGTGKESAHTGIDAILLAMQRQGGMIDATSKYVGPSNFASGSSMSRDMSERKEPCYLSLISEFGIRLNQICDPRANAAENSLLRTLLDFHSLSGKGCIVRPHVYSDTARNTSEISAPALSILGVSTPESLFEKLTHDSISNGLVPRFLTIAYQGLIPEYNRHPRQDVPDELIDKLCSVAKTTALLESNFKNEYVHIEMTEDAEEKSWNYQKEIRNRMNKMEEGPNRQILNRSHLKALRLAALVAAMDNPEKPKITSKEVEWGIAFEEAGAAYMLQQFEEGHVADDAPNFIENLIDEFMAGRVPQKLNVKEQKMIAAGYLPAGPLVNYAARLAVFKHDRKGGTEAAWEALRNLEKAGKISSCKKESLIEFFGFKGMAYVVEKD